MIIFLYEYITCGGSLEQPFPPRGSLLAEGRAMLSALVEDLTSIEHVDVAVMLDRRLSVEMPSCVEITRVVDRQSERETFTQLATGCDATILIAPEFDGILLERAEAVMRTGGKLLSPSPDVIRITADKQHTADVLASSGIQVSQGRAIKSGEPLPLDDSYPAVIKPADGAGSQDVAYLTSPDDLARFARTQERFEEKRWRLERFCAGMPVSCAVLCGGAHSVSLRACTQQFEKANTFSYSGGVTHLTDELNERAQRLAERAVAALPRAVGYVGVDMVLGDAADGSKDVVIEINPRLTTSYVGLREIAETNLAEAMLDVANGDEPEICWGYGSVEFRCDGTIVRSQDVFA